MDTRIAGCNLGKASASFVTGTVADNGDVKLGEPTYVLHEGKPFDVFRDWYQSQRIQDCAALGATGMYAVELALPTLILPEDACQEAALESLSDAPGDVNLVSVGARGYSVLSRSALQGGSGASNHRPGGHYRVRYIENEKCSSGTGENMPRIASRFGLTLEQADELAQGASRGIPITARCSVFAKSEMTHYANQGKPADELLAGYFTSVARNAGGLLARNRVDGPVYVIGGCARIRSFRDAFERHLGVPVLVPDDFLVFEAIGAARLVSAQLRTQRRAPLPSNPSELTPGRNHRLRVLAPASSSREKVTVLASLEHAPDLSGPCVLGLDLGSTGAKAVLVNLETGQPVRDLYDRTRGNPVDASRRLIRDLLAGGEPDIRAVAVTGSGREAVATLLRAVFPDASRVVVENEIVAHATAAIRCDPDGGKDLSVIEIGGQDAKYIRISGGRIVDSDMNKACSAGTGSFLEEQGQLYDLQDIEQLVALAKTGERPPDLGQMCTVYVADAAAQALREGFTLADIFAGFQYSIVHNYLDRVMGQRTLGAKVFFQGKPAANESLAWTLAAVTGRDVIVPPNPGAMGAWGIALHAIGLLGSAALREHARMSLDAALRAEVAERTSFACMDKDCRTLCPIERTTIRVGGEQRIALSGGACPKFEVAAQHHAKLAKDAPNPFDEREALIHALEGDLLGRPSIGIPVTGALCGYLPWLATFVRSLGFAPRLLRSDATSLAKGEQLCNSFDSCSPTKIAHAICDTDIPTLLFPKILDIAGPAGQGGQTCVTEQAMPEMVEQSLRAHGRDVRVVRPCLRFAKGLEGPELVESLLPLVNELGVTESAVRAAVESAAAAQRDYELGLAAAGQRAIDYAQKEHLPVVVVCGPLHVIHDPATNASVPQLLRQNGAMAVPMDCYPVDRSSPAMKRVYWGEPNRYLRVAAAAVASRDAYPLMLSSFGCGPASFTEQFFHSILEGYPHTILESDGHGGTAGFVTRIQAFMHSVRQAATAEPAGSKAPSKALSYLEAGGHTGSYLDRKVHYVFLSGIEYLGELFAAVYRSYGYDAAVAPPLSKANFEAGRRDCSGKECLSYQFVWGAFREYLKDHPPQPGRETRLVQISGQMCRAGVFGVKDRISLERLGFDGRVTVTALRTAGGPGMTARVWTGLAALDVLRQLHLYHLAVVDDHALAESSHRAFCDRVIEVAERRVPKGLSEAARTGRDWRALQRILGDASEHYARVGRESTVEGPFRTVFVTGDILTKGSDFANGHLYQRLARHRIRVLVEPTCDFLEFLSRAHPHLIFGSASSRSKNLTYTASQIAIRNRIYDLVRKQHGWMPRPDVGAVLEQAAEVLDLATNGGATLAVGSALHHWKQGHYDGLVTTACWGCDNGLVGESLLRHQAQIPSYFFYDDATPIDDRRLASFAFRLHRCEVVREPGDGARRRSLWHRIADARQSVRRARFVWSSQ